MQRYEVAARVPPQYLGGVGPYDVFYWAHGPYDGQERLILKWGSYDGQYYYWNFNLARWQNSYSQDVDTVTPTETKTILAMYDCFAMKPVTDETSHGDQ